MTVVVRPRALDDAGLDAPGVRTALVSAFEAVQGAIASDRPVVVVVPSADLLGHRGPERAALVGGLVGLARAVAFEGARPGWRINVLAVPDGEDLDDGAAAARVPAGASGQVIALGASLVGKVAP